MMMFAVATIPVVQVIASGQRMKAMTRPEGWQDHASCRDHPELDPDAWSHVIQGGPREVGAEALIVCRQVCPVMRECRQHFRGVGIVAGGGWFNGHGEFEDANGLLDIYQAAAYIGVTPKCIQTWLNRKLFSVKPRGSKSWFRVEDVRALAKHHGPKHGTRAAQRLHVIRGEQLCPHCRLGEEPIVKRVRNCSRVATKDLVTTGG